MFWVSILAELNIEDAKTSLAPNRTSGKKSLNFVIPKIFPFNKSTFIL